MFCGIYSFLFCLFGSIDEAYGIVYNADDGKISIYDSFLAMLSVLSQWLFYAEN